jgi:hypothetical protein
MGETSIDQVTFDEYLAEIREHYTADKVSTVGFLFIAWAYYAR